MVWYRSGFMRWLALGTIVVIALLVFLRTWPRTARPSNPINSLQDIIFPDYFQASKIDVGLADSKFWDDNAIYHGYDPSTNILAGNHVPVCQGFFSLWPERDCVDDYDDLNEKMRVLSAQMEVMNANLTLFVNDLNKCVFTFPRISVQLLDMKQILRETGFEPAFEIMDTWTPHPHLFTRLSDILRLGLAFKHGMAYMDTDVSYLELKRELYEKAYVGAALWSNEKNAIEITNSAFCLPKKILQDMLAFQRTRILKGGKRLFYTELGPSMFHNVLMNRHNVYLYSQNHPGEGSLDEIARGIHLYGHKQIHLTGNIRNNRDMRFGELVNTIRRKSGLPELVYQRR
jgi:hypothetical protein